MRQPDEPVPVATTAHCFDVRFHPRDPVVAASLVTGAVEFHKFDWERGTSELSRSLQCHKESCRAIRFLPAACGDAASEAAGGGNSTASDRLLSTAADSLVKVWDVERGKRCWRGRLGAAGNALVTLGPERFITGDDDGGILLHDTRQAKVAIQYAENEDFISDLATKGDMTLCSTSGDGTLAVYDLRKAGTRGLIAMSDFQEDEFMSLAIVKEGSKVVCGSQTGILCCFTWGDFGDQNDRIRGHPLSVDAMLKISDTRLLTGSSDGGIRAVAAYDKELNSGLVGVVADHGKYPVESLAMSPCGQMFASVSHGQPAVRIWPMELAHAAFTNKDASRRDVKTDEVDSDDSDDEGSKKKKKKKEKPKKKRRRVIYDENEREGINKRRQATNFFSGL